MSHGGDHPETCKFGHVFETDGDLSSPGKDVVEKIRRGEIQGLRGVREELGDDFLKPLMGDNWKKLKVSASSQGTPFAVVLTAADNLDENKDYSVERTEEGIYVAPQSQLHDEFMQRKQQAESKVKENMRNISELMKQKHMLEHDIRKLRSRAEAMSEKDEAVLKGDFVELVDGANAGSQQGGEAAMKTLVERNIYPTIVSDFYEMDSLDDLKPAEDREDDKDGVLADRPNNEKAILKKKYSMYEKWKDLYGSEVNRKLEDLKGQLKSIERSIGETKEWLEPYVKDMVQINKMGDLQSDYTNYYEWKGNSSMERNLEFICYKPLKKEHGDIVVADSEDEATHYRIIYIHGVHVNMASPGNPQSPAEGPSSGVVMWHPAIVCKHVFENFFKAKIEKYQDQTDELMKDYTGDFETEYGEELKEARKDEDMSVRKLREALSKELDEDIPLETSSKIRRIEDGLDPVDILQEDYIKGLDEVLETSLHEDNDKGEDMYGGFEKKLRKFTGQTDPFVIPPGTDPLGDLTHDMWFNYYWNFKLGFGLYTMN
ncbi:hypothetical protein AQV86_05190 [Nanohaloarchaea archaeon SG9]|nr:hypothetical protein AQV86_05190 [Nanohaloarchaea archaeon SG9]